MRRPTRRERRQEENAAAAPTDMTPMIDVVFLLIIFFLCIDFRVLEAKLPAHLPKDVGAAPTRKDPVDRIRVAIVCDARGTEEARPSGSSYRLVGHRVHFELGARRDLPDLETLAAELRTLRADPSRQVPDPRNPGRTRPAPVVIEPGAGVVYGDVAPCVDTVTAAGFYEVHFGGGRGRR